MGFSFQPDNQDYQNQAMLKLGWDHNIVILKENSWQKANLVDKLTSYLGQTGKYQQKLILVFR